MSCNHVCLTGTQIVMIIKIKNDNGFKKITQIIKILTKQRFNNT